MLDEYLLNHQVIVYDVILDEAPAENRQAELQQIRKTFPDMNETPSLYLIKDGKLVNQLQNDKDGLSKKRFDEWVQEYQLDAENKDSYKRSTKEGKVEKITVAQMQEKLDKKQSFPIVFTQTTCGGCKDFKKMLDEYLKTHQVVVYDVILDEAPEENRQAELQQIRETFPGMNETPSLYLIKDGKLNNQLKSDKDGISKERFDKWVQEYQMDAIK